MKPFFFWRGLSGRLLILTILFVMLAEVILFVPSAAMYRQNWLEQRAESAQQLTLAIMGVENFQGSKLLTTSFMDNTDVTAVMQKRDGMTEKVLGMPPPDAVYTIIDLRQERRFPDFGALARSYFGDGEGYMRVWAKPSVPGAQALEIIIPNAALKQALVDYCHRVIGLSILIALFTGLLIYFALSWLIVRPVQRLARALSAFHEDPEHHAGFITDSKRKDEIGVLEREFIDLKTGIRGALKQKDRLATLGLAVAKINHDLRNVLTSAQLISDRLATDAEPRVRKMGERLVRAVDRGVQLCAATLSYSKSNHDAPQPQTIRLASLLGEAAGDAIQGLGRRQECDWVNTVPTELTVMADPDQTYRIFNNLFRNSVQAMIRNDPSVRDRLSVAHEIVKMDNNSEQVLVHVSDSGPGLSDRAKESLFKPFTGDSKGGTGLGLVIARELAQGHGGDLRLETTGPNGTTFTVLLPKGPR